jgi:hypothetical protein
MCDIDSTGSATSRPSSLVYTVPPELEKFGSSVGVPFTLFSIHLFHFHYHLFSMIKCAGCGEKEASKLECPNCKK